MRWILITLLLLNITLFAWFWRAAPADLEIAESGNGESSMSLVLLSEEADVSPRVVPQILSDIETTLVCYEVGPFIDSSDAEQFRLSHGISFDNVLENRQVQTRTDYRVYLPPYSSREAAGRALEELRAALLANKLDIDTLVITRGDMENGIALGLFSEQRNALNVERQLAQLGYVVSILEEPRFQEQLWISLRERMESAKLMAQWPIMQQQRPYLQRLEKLC
jgi:hypothetical protein